MITRLTAVFASAAALLIAAAQVPGVAGTPQIVGGGGATNVPALPGNGQPAPTFPFEFGRGQQPQAPIVWTGVIVGRVVDGSSGRPVPGVIVQASGGTQPRQIIDPTTGARPMPPEQPPRFMTDSEGRFAFRNLSRGSYSISAQKQGYASSSYGQSRPNGQGRALTLADDQRIGDVVIRIFKYATVTGMVVDEVGDPVIGINVRAYRRTLVGGKRVLRVANSAGGNAGLTDDRGEYRLAGLLPGEYVVVVPITQQSVPSDFMMGGPMSPNLSSTLQTPNGLGSSIGRGDTPGSADGRFMMRSATNGPASVTSNRDANGRIAAYPTQYYPGTSTSADATPILLQSGEERAGIDLALRLAPTAAITGQVEGPEGPAINYALHLVPSATGEMSGEPDVAQAITDATGSFMFLGVPPGQYVIQTIRMPRQGGAPPPPPPMPPGARGGGGGSFTPILAGQAQPSEPVLWLAQPIAVGATDVLGLGLRLQTGYTMAGRVEFDGVAARPAPDRLRSVPVSVESVSDMQQPFMQPQPIQPDGRFTTPGLIPGDYTVRIGGNPPGWTLRSVMYEGADIADVPVHLDKNITGIVITFTDRPSDLRVSVRVAQGPTDIASVLVFPAETRMWAGVGNNPRRFRTMRAPASGSTVTMTLPPGDYYAIAIREESTNEWMDPKFLEQLARSASRVTIGDGQHATVDLEMQDVRPAGGRNENDEADAESEHGPFVPDEQQTRDVPIVRAGNGVLSGTVLSTVGDAPIRRARVSVSNGELRVDRSTLTDDQGRWIISDLPPGLYTLSASKPAYLATVYGMRGPGRGMISASARVKVEGGKPVEGLTMRMTRGGVLAGRATDQFGQPVANAQVVLGQYVTVNGERTFRGASMSGSRMTDDRGAFRVYGINPGTYILSVTPQNEGVSSDVRLLSEGEMRGAIAEVARPSQNTLPSTPLGQNGPGPPMPGTSSVPRPAAPSPPQPRPGGQSVGYTMTFFPGTVIQEEATPIVVAAGQEVTGIEVLVRLIRTSRIDGIVYGMDGQVVARPNVQLQSNVPGGGSRSWGLRMTGDGRFSAVGVAPGRYQVVASQNEVRPPPVPVGMAPGGPPPPPTSLPTSGLPTLVQYARQEIDINGEDVTGIELRMTEAMTLTGRIVFQSPTRKAPTDLTGLTISLQPGPGASGSNLGVPFPRANVIDAEGNFVMKGVLPGRVRLVASLPNRGGEQWVVKSATLNGVDTLDAAAEIPAGASPRDAVIVMTDQVSELTGTVTDQNGAGVPSLVVMIFATDHAFWSNSRRTRVSQVDTTGSTGSA